MTVYTITNNTPQNQSFDDKTLTPNTSVDVPKLTDDILKGWTKGVLAVSPDPTDAAIQWVRVFGDQLPLPVRMIGNFQGLFTPGTLKNAPTVNVTETAVRVVPPDDSRVNLRLRNVGVHPVALGGSDVQFSTAVHVIAPGELFNEAFAPNLAWYAITDVGQISTLVGLIVQT